MTSAFDLSQAAWSYAAVTPAPIARELGIARGQSQLARPFPSAQPAAYWARQTRGYDWSQEDRIPAVPFNQILWKGLTGGATYPAVRSGTDLSRNREMVLSERSRHFLYEQP